MKTAVLCIAAEFERPYLEEWWNWHHSLGFDDIHVITNNWSLDISAPSFVHNVRVDGQVAQLPAYNTWLLGFKEKYDWLLVIDVDEFLWMPDDLKTYLEFHHKDYCVGVPWVHFGDGFSKETSGSVIQRFQRCEGVYNKHVKPLVSLERVSQNKVHFVNPHFVCCDNFWLPWTDIDGKLCTGPYSNLEGREIDSRKPFLAHFYTKTKEEWRKRRGPEHMRADCPQYVTEDWFDRENHNEKQFTLLAERQKGN